MNFDKVAPYYSLLEKLTFGNNLHDARLAFVPKLTKAKNILLIGEGRGRLLNEILKHNSLANITIVESSRAMISEMKKLPKVKNVSSIKFENLCFFHFSTQERFDAICTCFFWDCFKEKEVKTGVDKVNKLLEANGLWINVDFKSPINGGNVEKFAHCLLIKLLYEFFRISCGVMVNKLPAVSPIAKENQFVLIGSKEKGFPFLCTEIFKKLS